MTMLHDVYADLRTMSLLHLLLAFLAFSSYLFAEGHLIPSRARAGAAALALLSVAAFVVTAPQWTTGIMLVVLAIGLIGVFAAIVWGLSATLGLGRGIEPVALRSADAAAAVADADDRRPAPVARPGPLHSH